MLAKSVQLNSNHIDVMVYVHIFFLSLYLFIYLFIFKQFYHTKYHVNNIVIKYGVQSIYICWASREVLKASDLNLGHTCVK